MLGAVGQAREQESKMASKSITLEAILNEVTLVRKQVEELMARQAPKGSAKAKAPKEVDPDAPKKAPNAWILFTGRVRAVLKENGLPAGKEAQQYASYLKNSLPEGEAYGLDEEAILARHSEWTPPPPKPKEEAEEEEAKPKEKPKRTLSDEHKAKMAAGRKAAAERRKAEAAAKEAEAALEALEGLVEAAVPPPKAAPAPKAPAKALKALPFKGKKLLMDEATGGCWENKEGVKGKWLGVMEGTGKDRVLKADAEEPEEE
jgi:colicin import membrane protein